MEKNEEKARVKKAWSWKEGRTQKMMAFRVDVEIAEKLAGVVNKGRLINELLRNHFAQEEREDREPEGDKKEDNEA